MTQRKVEVRRVYDQPGPGDGLRILVDRVWPRGLRRDAAALDEWAKEVAPSTELRRWYGHVPDRFDQFRSRYRRELAVPTTRAALDRLRALSDDHVLTLLTASRDLEHSQAAVLAELLRESR